MCNRCLYLEKEAAGYSPSQAVCARDQTPHNAASPGTPLQKPKPLMLGVAHHGMQPAEERKKPGVRLAGLVPPAASSQLSADTSTTEST